jgi:hypothetical protein
MMFKCACHVNLIQKRFVCNAHGGYNDLMIRDP